MRLWNQDYTRAELRRRVGDLSQVCGVRQSVLADGPGRGMRAFDVTNGSGLSFTVLPDRGMDIAWCSYKSIPISFISKTGPVHPSLCHYGGNDFLRGFTGGLLTTCGYTHMGSACRDEGSELALHGRATLLPSDDTAVLCGFEGDDYVMRIRGRMRESAVLGEDVQLYREIRASAGENVLHITDRLENAGSEAQPLMLLYHFNFGHPLLGEAAKLVTPPGRVIPRDSAAAEGLADCKSFHSPVSGYGEQVFYHDPEPDGNGRVRVTLQNSALGLSASLCYNKSELPCLIQWKQLGNADYVCGLEPATWYPEGRAEARKRGELALLAPGETRVFHLSVELGEL